MPDDLEPYDVELFVGGAPADSSASVETAQFIKDYKRRLDDPRESAAAAGFLASLGLETRDGERLDPGALLDHWRECVANLLRDDHGATHGTTGLEVPAGIDSGSRGEAPK